MVLTCTAYHSSAASSCDHKAADSWQTSLHIPEFDRPRCRRDREVLCAYGDCTPLRKFFHSQECDTV